MPEPPAPGNDVLLAALTALGAADGHWRLLKDGIEG